MAAFTYDGLNRQGQNVHGEVVADNSSQAINKLREAGIIVTEMKEKANNANKMSSKSGGKVTTEDVAVFCRQLAVMLSAGVPITRALATLSKQTENGKFANAIDTIAEALQTVSTQRSALGAVQNRLEHIVHRHDCSR